MPLSVKILLSSLFAFIVFSCNKTTGPVFPDVTTTETELANFQVIIADYDSVIFKSNDDLLIKNKDVTEIVLGKKVSGIFTPIDTSSGPGKTQAMGRIYKQNKNITTLGEKTVEPIYTKVGDKYRLEFEISIKVDNTTYLEHYLLQFIMTDDTYIEIDVPVHFYQYPYENAEIFMLQEEHESLVGLSAIQDFDIVDDQLFYHPYGPVGLYKYNLSTHAAPDALYDYSGGDHIAVSENYVFIDYSHSRIERYNVDSDSIELVFDLSQISWADCDYYCSNLGIYGIAASNGVVYAIMFDQSDENLYLSQFDYEGNYLGSIPWTEEYPYNLEYHDGVLYSYKYFFGEDEILRFDLNSMSFLESKPIPSASPDGISIVNGRFYYADYYRHLICSIPMSDLMD